MNTSIDYFLQGDPKLTPVVIPRYKTEDKLATMLGTSSSSIPIPLPSRRSAGADPEGLDLSVNLPFEMLRRRYVQAIPRGNRGHQVNIYKGFEVFFLTSFCRAERRWRT